MANLAHVDSRPFSNDQIDLGSSINLKFNDILPESPSFTHLWCIYNASNHNLSTTISTKYELISWYLSLYCPYIKFSSQFRLLPLIMLSTYHRRFQTTLLVKTSRYRLIFHIIRIIYAFDIAFATLILAIHSI